MPGAELEIAGDQTILINLGGVAGDVCGRIYFWYQADGSYVVEACKNHIELVSVTESSRWKRLDRSEQVWQGEEFPARIGIEVKDAAATVFINGRETLTSPLNEPTLKPAGSVELASGVYGEEKDSHALFFGIEIWDS